MRSQLLVPAVLLLTVILAPAANAWDGIDTETGDVVEIDSGNLVRTGRDIDVYDYGSGEYRNVTVESITRSGNSVELEVYDYDKGQTRTFEMNDPD